MNRPILIVEDEESIRTLCRKVLEREGYRIVEAENGEAALIAFESDPPRLVITDLRMPHKDGLQTLTHIARHHGEVPILAISSGDNRTFLDMALAFGASDTLEKPFDTRDLLEAVRRLLGPRPEDEEEHTRS
ncbi:MAG: response regulator [Planctomycetes bacterium]|nr:response regulator [Planctomycetota bacterium]MCB9891910.1 response regulator [Planctomycetota bacterium]